MDGTYIFNILEACHRWEEEKGSSHSCWHMAQLCCIEAVPSDTHQGFGRMEAVHSQSCTNLAGVYGYSQKS